MPKMGQNFHNWLRSGPRGLTRDPSYGCQPDRKKAVFLQLPWVNMGYIYMYYATIGKYTMHVCVFDATVW